MESRSVRLWYLLLSWVLFSVLLLAIDLLVLAAPDETSPIELLETVASDLSQIEAEPGVDGYGESMTESVSESETDPDYYAIAYEALERAEYESLAAKYAETPEETTLSMEEDFLVDVPLAQVNAVSAPALRSGYGDMPKSEAYLIELDGTQYYCWFPSGQELEVTSEDHPYNPGSSNITAVISTTLDGVSLDGYNDFVTFAPLLSTSSNNNAYRYGSRCYVTHYYIQGSSLYNSVSYVSSAVVLDQPGSGYGFSRYQIAVLFALLLLVVFGFMRGSRK